MVSDALPLQNTSYNSTKQEQGVEVLLIGLNTPQLDLQRW